MLLSAPSTAPPSHSRIEDSPIARLASPRHLEHSTIVPSNARAAFAAFGAEVIEIAKKDENSRFAFIREDVLCVLGGWQNCCLGVRRVICRNSFFRVFVIGCSKTQPLPVWIPHKKCKRMPMAMLSGAWPAIKNCCDKRDPADAKGTLGAALTEAAQDSSSRNQNARGAYSWVCCEERTSSPSKHSANQGDVLDKTNRTLDRTNQTLDKAVKLPTRPLATQKVEILSMALTQRGFERGASISFSSRYLMITGA